MNPRERILAMGLVGVLAIVGGYFALLKPFYFDALKERDATIARLQKDITERSDKVQQIQRDLPKLERWRVLSLPNPNDPVMSQRAYEIYLTDLLRDSGFTAASGTRVTPEPPDINSSPKLSPTKKEPIYTLLPFKVVAHGDLSSLVKMMEDFYRTGLLHRIKNLAIRKPLTASGPQQQQRVGELDIDMTIEAAIINGAESRQILLPNISRRLLRVDVMTGMYGYPTMLALVPWAVGPAGLLGPRVLAQPPRQYASIVAKNIFTPASATVRDRSQEVEATRFVFLNTISRGGKYYEAILYDLYNNFTFPRLRAEPESGQPSRGFDSFNIRGDEGESLMRGTVVRISTRDLIFRVDENYYSFHVGQSLKDALKDNRLTTAQLKDLGIALTAEKLTSEQ
jgi:hypothetical protein